MVPKSPADINMYVNVSGLQYFINQDGKITEDLAPLIECKK